VADASEYEISNYSRGKAIDRYKKGSCRRIAKSFDIYVMKPLFVYKYDMVLARKRDEFFEKFRVMGQDMEAEYLNQEIEKEQDER